MMSQLTASSTEDHIMTGRRRVARMLWVVAGLFALSWLPYHTVSLYLNFVSDNDTVSLTALSVALLVGHSQSAQNPVVYCIMSNTFKDAMTSALHCRRQHHSVHLNTHQVAYLSHQWWVEPTFFHSRPTFCWNLHICNLFSNKITLSELQCDNVVCFKHVKYLTTDTVVFGDFPAISDQLCKSLFTVRCCTKYEAELGLNRNI